MEEEEQAAVGSAFPAPPPFYQTFTPENIDRLQKHLESEKGFSSTTFRTTEPTIGTLPDIASVPSAIRNLVPPPAPQDGTYSLFGTVHTINPASTDVSSPPNQPRLLHLIHQMLLKFLSITHILSIDPSNKFYAPAWDQLNALFTEMHQGINAWRPHQTRETLIEMMEDQIAKVKEETQQIRESVGRAREVVEGIAKSGQKYQGVLIQNGTLQNDESRMAAKVEEKRKRAKQVWQAIEGELAVA